MGVFKSVKKFAKRVFQGWIHLNVYPDPLVESEMYLASRRQFENKHSQYDYDHPVPGRDTVVADLQTVVDVDRGDAAEVAEPGHEPSEQNALKEQHVGTEEEKTDEELEFLETWGPILAIPDKAFVELSQHLFGSSKHGIPVTYMVEKRTQGTYNHAVIVNDGSSKFIVKIPVVGTSDRWKPQHAAILRSEAHTMKHILNTLPNFSIPKVLGYDESLDNEIGAPHIILSFVDGIPSHHLWFGLDEDGELDLEAPDTPLEERDRLRTAFLRSLAKNMAQLRHLEFGTTGMLVFEGNDPAKPVIGPHYGWQERGSEAQRVYYERPTFDKAAEYYEYRINQKYGKESSDRMKGQRFILQCMFNSAPFSQSKKHPDDEAETFTLQHSDFSFQNILVDSYTGEVTGIIDWDCSIFVPRCVGYVSVPDFLRDEWEEDYALPECAVTSPWNLHKYRSIYSDAIMQACGGQECDAKYTHQSALYTVMHNALYGFDAIYWTVMEDMMQKVLMEIPMLRRVVLNGFDEKVGQGWPEARQVLEREIPKVLAWR